MKEINKKLIDKKQISMKQKPINISNVTIVPSNGVPQKVYSSSVRPNPYKLEFK